MQKECLCPICEENNLCQVCSTDCWCKDVVIPASLLDLIPKGKQGKSCVCLQCIDRYKKSPEKLLAIVKNK